MGKDQTQTPFLTQLIAYANSDTAPFDVPGHKLGQIEDDFATYLGLKTLKLDSNAPRGLDNLSNPQGVLKEAQDLMAEAYGASRAYFLTGGTSEGILAMIMSACRAKEKIIMPRNVHKSVVNGLILSGAIPIFMTPEMDHELGIANGVSLETVKKTILEHPDAKALFIINPTYFGAASNLKEIVEFAHQHKMAVLVDEAHGAHFGFTEQLPVSAMQAGADMSACSIHKTVGSLTQSSVLLLNSQLIEHNLVKSTLNILRTTSPSSLLMASLDSARKHIYLHGKEKLDRIIEMAQKTRSEIDKIPGLSTYGKQYFESRGATGYDQTKIIIKVSELGLTGFDAYKILFDNYHVQLELAETHIVLAVLSMGTTQAHLDALVKGLKGLAETHHKPKIVRTAIRQTDFEAYTRPREAYHAPKKYVHASEALNTIAAESIMIYPPGIPIVIPGEIISQDVLDDLAFYKQQGSMILSDTEDGLIKVIDTDHWSKWDEDEL